MSALIRPKRITVDGLSVRYAEGGQDGPDAMLMSPWPESVYAFEPAWPHLAAAAHLVAIDPPGFGGSDYRQTLMNPKAMGHFILKVADALGLDNPHIVGPDIGTSWYCSPPPTRTDSAASSSAVAEPRYRWMSPAFSRSGSKHATWSPTARSAGARSSRSPC